MSPMPILVPVEEVPATKVKVVPSTTSVSPVVMLVARSFEVADGVPDSSVAPVIAVAPPVLSLLIKPPVTVLLVKGDSVPTAKGLKPAVKSAALMPPAAVMVPVAADELAGVFGWVGRLAA